MALGTPVLGTVAYSAQGGTSVAPSYPTGVQATDDLVLIVGQKPSTANSGTVTTPTGWTLRESLIGAGGYGTTLGIDTGNTNLFIYTKDTVTGAETGTLTVTVGTNNVCWSGIVRIPSGTGNFLYASADGQQSTTPTASLSVTLNSATVAATAGDIFLTAMCIPTDVTTPAQYTVGQTTISGLTVTNAELSEPDSATGNDIGGFIGYSTVTAGSATGNPVFTATVGGTLTNVRGPVATLRIRELAGTTFNDSRTEAATAGESSTAGNTTDKAATESASATEASSAGNVTDSSATESASATEVITGGNTADGSASESASATEVITGGKTTSSSASESVAALDSVIAAPFTRDVNTDEALSATDENTVIADLSAATSETGSSAASADGSRVILADITEFVADLHDDLGGSLGSENYTLEIADAMEEQSSVLDASAARTEAASAQEAATSTLVSAASESESLTAADTLTAGFGKYGFDYEAASGDHAVETTSWYANSGGTQGQLLATTFGITKYGITFIAPKTGRVGFTRFVGPSGTNSINANNGATTNGAVEIWQLSSNSVSATPQTLIASTPIPPSFVGKAYFDFTNVAGADLVAGTAYAVLLCVGSDWAFGVKTASIATTPPVDGSYDGAYSNTIAQGVSWQGVWANGYRAPWVDVEYANTTVDTLQPALSSSSAATETASASNAQSSERLLLGLNTSDDALITLDKSAASAFTNTTTANSTNSSMQSFIAPRSGQVGSLWVRASIDSGLSNPTTTGAIELWQLASNSINAIPQTLIASIPLNLTGMATGVQDRAFDFSNVSAATVTAGVGYAIVFKGGADWTFGSVKSFNVQVYQAGFFGPSYDTVVNILKASHTFRFGTYGTWANTNANQLLPVGLFYAAATDTETQTISIPASESESLTASENSDQLLVTSANVAETGAGSDSSTYTYAAVGAVTETGSAAESIAQSLAARAWGSESNAGQTIVNARSGFSLTTSYTLFSANSAYGNRFIASSSTSLGSVSLRCSPQNPGGTVPTQPATIELWQLASNSLSANPQTLLASVSIPYSSITGFVQTVDFTAVSGAAVTAGIGYAIVFRAGSDWSGSTRYVNIDAVTSSSSSYGYLSSLYRGISFDGSWSSVASTIFMVDVFAANTTTDAAERGISAFSSESESVTASDDQAALAAFAADQAEAGSSTEYSESTWNANADLSESGSVSDDQSNTLTTDGFAEESSTAADNFDSTFVADTYVTEDIAALELVYSDVAFLAIRDESSTADDLANAIYDAQAEATEALDAADLVETDAEAVYDETLHGSLLHGSILHGGAGPFLIVELTGSASVAADASADLGVSVNLVGTTSGQASVSVSAGVAWALDGTGAITATAAANVTAVVGWSLSGSSSAIAITTATASLSENLQGSLSAVANTGAASLKDSKNLTGSLSATAATTGLIRGFKALLGSSTATVTSTGNLLIVKAVIGATGGAATTTASLFVRKNLAGASVSVVTTTGSLSRVLGSIYVQGPEVDQIYAQISAQVINAFVSSDAIFAAAQLVDPEVEADSGQILVTVATDAIYAKAELIDYDLNIEIAA